MQSVEELVDKAMRVWPHNIGGQSALDATPRRDITRRIVEIVLEAKDD